MGNPNQDVEKQLQTTDSGATASESYWFLMSPKEVAHKLDTSIDDGLKDGAVKERQARDGPNELTGGGGVSVWSILAGQLFSEFSYFDLLYSPTTSRYPMMMEADSLLFRNFQQTQWFSSSSLVWRFPSVFNHGSKVVLSLLSFSSMYSSVSFSKFPESR